MESQPYKQKRQILIEKLEPYTTQEWNKMMFLIIITIKIKIVQTESISHKSYDYSNKQTIHKDKRRYGRERELTSTLQHLAFRCS